MTDWIELTRYVMALKKELRYASDMDVSYLAQNFKGAVKYRPLVDGVPVGELYDTREEAKKAAREYQKQERGRMDGQRSNHP